MRLGGTGGASDDVSFPASIDLLRLLKSFSRFISIWWIYDAETPATRVQSNAVANPLVIYFLEMLGLIDNLLIHAYLMI